MSIVAVGGTLPSSWGRYSLPTVFRFDGDWSIVRYLGRRMGALPSIGGLSLLTCSSTQLSSAVCFWCMQGIEPDTDPVNDYQLLSDVKASTAPWCNCVMSSTNALLPFTVTRSVTSREMSIAVESRDQGSCSVKFSRSMRFRLDL